MEIIQLWVQRHPVKCRVLVAALLIAAGLILTPSDEMLGRTLSSEIQYILSQFMAMFGGAVLGSTANIVFREYKEHKKQTKRDRTHL